MEIICPVSARIGSYVLGLSESCDHLTSFIHVMPVDHCSSCWFAGLIGLHFHGFVCVCVGKHVFLLFDVFESLL